VDVDKDRTASSLKSAETRCWGGVLDSAFKGENSGSKGKLKETFLLKSESPIVKMKKKERPINEWERPSLRKTAQFY